MQVARRLTLRDCRTDRGQGTEDGRDEDTPTATEELIQWIRAPAATVIRQQVH
jgi:hypothetical protein